MKKTEKKKIQKVELAIDTIEKAKTYSLLSINYPEKAIFIGSRKKLAQILLHVKVDDIIATYGSKQRCIIIMDYTLGDLMDLIVRNKYSN